MSRVLLKDNNITAHTVSAQNYAVGGTNFISASRQGNFRDIEVKNNANTATILITGGTDGVSGGDISITGTLSSDTISEKTDGSGVTIDSVLLKDNNITAHTVSAQNYAVGGTNFISASGQGNFRDIEVKDNANTATILITGGTSGVSGGDISITGTLSTNTISEKTSASGVTIDSVLLKDGDISANNINLYGNIISDNNVKTITVTVASKTSNHPEYGNGSGSGYLLDGVESPELELVRGITYKFDQSDSSNSGHPFRFYEDKNKSTSYSTGVTTNGSAGSSGAYSQIKVAYNAPDDIFYQCTAHGLMGHKFKVVSKSVFNDVSANDVSFNVLSVKSLKVNGVTIDTNGGSGGTTLTTSSDISINAIDAIDTSFNNIKANFIEAFTLKGSIIPDVDDTYDIGSSTKTIRDLYLGPNSLYVNGKQILHDESGTITFTTTSGQNLSVKTSGSGLLKLESETGGITSTSTGNISFTGTGTGNVSLTTNSGDITLDSTSGQIELKTNIEITDTKKFTSTGNNIQFGDNIQLDSGKKLIGDVTGNADTVTNGVYTTSSVTALSDVTSSGSGAIITSSERTKLSGISSLNENTDISVNNINLHGNIISDNNVKTITVTVASKTSNHPEYGNGSGSGYLLNGVESPELELVRGMTYKFDQSDSSNSGHPFRFYEDKNKSTSYSTGVTTNGSAGSSGAYSQIKVAYNAPDDIFYQCTAHGLMGHKFKVVSKSVFGDISANDVSFNTVNTGLLTVGESVYDTGRHHKYVYISSR